MPRVINVAGEAVSEELSSDAECCRWFLEQGRVGDYLSDTGELMSAVVAEVLDLEVRFDLSGCVLPSSKMTISQHRRGLST